jgi:Cu/Zn superoxide dismutase
MLSRTVALLVVAAFLPACDTGDDVDVEPDLDATPGAEFPQETTTPTPIEAMTATFQPAGGSTAMISGTASFMRDGDELELTVNLNGLPEGDHAWHIHQGGCDADGPVVLAFSETADMEGIGDDLEADGDGHAEASVDIPADRAGLLNAGEHSIHVHQSGGEDHGPAIACAPIMNTSSATTPMTTPMPADTGNGM